jgi:putative dehydrogenase
MSDTIAVIAPGEMGAAIGGRLREHGARVLTSLAGRSAASAQRAERAGLIAVANDDEIAGADIILSVVPPKDALGLAERLKPALTRATTKPIYVDCNAVAPETAKKIGAVLADTGCVYVDGGIVGLPPTPNSTSTKLYVSGPAAKQVARLNQYGFDTRPIDGGIGAASALKMSYAGITKGFTAVVSMMILGASRAGCADDFRKELAESQPHFLAWLSRQVPRMYPKAYRWVAEMEEIGAFLGDEVGHDAYQAIARFYAGIADIEARERSDGDDLALLTAFCTDKPDVPRKAG